MTLLTETVTMKWNGRNKAHYTALGYNFNKMGNELEIPVEHLPSGSHVKVKVKCDYCGEDFSTTWQIFLRGRKVSKKDACGNGTCYTMKRSEIRDGYYTTIADVPELLKEWCPTNKVDPSRVLTGSEKKYRWICSVEESHTWGASPNNRTSGKTGCPVCQESRGEKLIASILEDLGVDFSREVEFPNGKLIGEGNGFLRYDFGILLNGQLIALIEYDGGQHFKPIEYFGGQAGYDRIVRHDTLKDEYAELNDLSLLRIRYDLPESEIKRQVTDFVESCLSFERLLNNVKVYG